MCREDSESAIIATLIHHPEFFYNAENLLPLHFSKRDNQFLYTAITSLIKRDVPNIDALNILESLASEPATCAFSREITVDRVQELIDMSDNIARHDIKEYILHVNAVIDAAFRRDMYQKLEECKRMCLDMRESNLQKKISDAVDGLMVAYSTTSDIQPFSEVIDDCWTDIQSRYGTGYAGLPFRFNALNDYVTMEKGELVVFGGSAKMGKSMMLLNHAMDLLRADKSVLYLDSELNDVLFTKRVLAHLTGIEYRRINDGTFTPEEGERIRDAIEWVKHKQFTHLYIPMFDLQSIYTAVKKVYHRQGGLDVLVVDYFKGSSEGDAFDSYQELGRFVDLCKNQLCGDMGIAGIAAAQATDSGKLADSAKIARNASTICMIMEKSEEEIQTDGAECGNKKLRVIFNRNGPQMTSKEYIDLNFDGDHVSYTEAKQHIPNEPF